MITQSTLRHVFATSSGVYSAKTSCGASTDSGLTERFSSDDMTADFMGSTFKPEKEGTERAEESGFGPSLSFKSSEQSSGTEVIYGYEKPNNACGGSTQDGAIANEGRGQKFLPSGSWSVMTVISDNRLDGRA